eukprot:scaffold35221_cov21-Tisochrysis_lutea.AAC.2
MAYFGHDSWAAAFTLAAHLHLPGMKLCCEHLASLLLMPRGVLEKLVSFIDAHTLTQCMYALLSRVRHSWAWLE